MLLGCTNLKIGKFILFSVLNSTLWSIMITLIGYIFGNVVYVFVSDIKKYEEFIIPSILILVTILIFIYRRIVREREKAYGDQ